MNIKKSFQKGQVLMEFSFCMIIAVLLMLALVMAFKWSSIDFANRRIAHDDSLVTNFNDNWVMPADGPLKQLNPDFFNNTTNLQLVR